MFYKIGEVARITGLEPYVLRYWETEFPEINPQKGRGGQREYRRRDLDVILAIQVMLHRDQYTIAGAKRKLRDLGIKACTEAPSEDTPEVASDLPKNGINEAHLRATEAEVVQKTEKGLRELLQLMDNTDSLRSN